METWKKGNMSNPRCVFFTHTLRKTSKIAKIAEFTKYAEFGYFRHIW